ncbi:MAG: galactokinase [Gemmatimonadetes bacterium]|nr:galactokinase [Gemmatimonadota bacterium]
MTGFSGAQQITAAVRAHLAFRETFGGEPELLARAPGRINLIGEHVDYNGGLVLPTAIDRDVVVAASRRRGRWIRAVAADLKAHDAFALDGQADAGSGWTSYLRGISALLPQSDIILPGADLAIAGDVPRGAGLASSAAFEVACATAFLALADETLPGPDLARLCRRAETEWAGVPCGIMDQFVAVLARKDHALFLDCRSLAFRHVAIPPGVRLIAADTGVRHELASSAYGARVQECRDAAERLGVAELRDVEPAELERKQGALPEPLLRRARFVVSEIERTRRAAEALAAGDLPLVGRLIDESHAGLRDQYEVSTPELDALVGAAREIDGVYGSRMVGAGFGGCTLSLVAEEAVPEFLRRVPAAYHEATGRTAALHVCRTHSGAGLLPLDA